MRLCIHIKPLDGITRTVSVDSEDTAEVLLRGLYEDACSRTLQREQCRLFFAGTELEDHRTLASYNIPGESTLHETLRMPGGVIMTRGRDMASFFAPVNKKVRETNQGIERTEEQKEREPEESVEDGEREDSDTERDIPEGEEDEEEGEEEENIQGQREEQPERQKGELCGSITAPTGPDPKDEDKGVSRTESMDQLADMQKDESRCSIL